MVAEVLAEKVKDSLGAHPNEAVLVIVRSWERYGFSSGRSVFPRVFEEELYLGVITKPFLSYHPGNLFEDLEIHTSKYARSKNWLRRNKLDFREGSIKGHKIILGNLNNKLGPKPKEEKFQFGHFPEPDFPPHIREDKKQEKLALEIIAGDQTVTAWFVNDAQFGRMEDYEKEILERREELSKLDTETAEYANWHANHLKEIHLNLDELISYQRMRAALGLTPAVLPLGLESKVNVKIGEDKLKIIEGIE